MENELEYNYQEDEEYISIMVEKIKNVIKELKDNNLDLNKYKKQVKEILDVAFKTIDDDFHREYSRYLEKNNLLLILKSKSEKNYQSEYFNIIGEAKSKLDKNKPQKHTLFFNDHNKKIEIKTQNYPKIQFEKNYTVCKNHGCI